MLLVEEENTKPEQFILFQNYPNPFNGQTTIRYELAQDSTVSVIIYNVIGQKVTQRVDTTQDAGVHQINWNAIDMPSGLYFIRLAVGTDYNKVRKALIIK